MKPRVLIVDGHSMIFQWPDLDTSARQTHRGRPRIPRQNAYGPSGQHRLACYRGLRWRRGQTHSRTSCPQGIQVFYSTADQSADSVIERLAAKYSDRYEVTVATDDLMERTTVASFGANSMSAWQFREEIETAGRDLDERLRQMRRH